MKNLKNKILDNLLTIFVIVFIFGSITLTWNAAAIPNTDPEPTIPDSQLERKYDLGQLFTKQIPTYCGETSFILETSAQIMLESQILVGEVRQGGQPFGDVIGILSFGHSAERNSGTFFMTIPGVGTNNESLTCILGFGLNWRFFDDEGNLVLGEDSL
tara:strand:+ start:494 stop:967 length:474 start_codon:yes stop_codon:yes gene_type:complete